jgi:hypothetical protein
MRGIPSSFDHFTGPPLHPLPLMGYAAQGHRLFQKLQNPDLTVIRRGYLFLSSVAHYRGMFSRDYVDAGQWLNTALLSRLIGISSHSLHIQYFSHHLLAQMIIRGPSCTVWTGVVLAQVPSHAAHRTHSAFFGSQSVHASLTRYVFLCSSSGISVFYIQSLVKAGSRYSYPVAHAGRVVLLIPNCTCSALANSRFTRHVRPSNGSSISAYDARRIHRIQFALPTASYESIYQTRHTHTSSHAIHLISEVPHFSNVLPLMQSATLSF